MNLPILDAVILIMMQQVRLMKLNDGGGGGIIIMVTRSHKIKRLLKLKVFKDCAPLSSHLPFLLSMSRPKKSVGTSCSLRPLMSWPVFTSFAIFWASLSCLAGLVAITLNENASFIWSGCN